MERLKLEIMGFANQTLQTNGSNVAKTKPLTLNQHVAGVSPPRGGVLLGRGPQGPQD